MWRRKVFCCWALCHLNTFRRKARFSTWMTRNAMNEAFMLLRRRRGTPEDLPESFTTTETSPFPEKFVDQRADASSSRAGCVSATQILTERHQSPGNQKFEAAILLRDIEERSAEETARILGTTISAVKALRSAKDAGNLRAAVKPRPRKEVYSADWAETGRC